MSAPGYRNLSFGFASDNTFSDESTGTINWAAQTVSYPGANSVPFAVLQPLCNVINKFATQDVTDGDTETEMVVNGGGPTVRYNPIASPTIAPGTAAFPVAKAMNLRAALQKNILDVLNPPAP